MHRNNNTFIKNSFFFNFVAYWYWAVALHEWYHPVDGI